MSEWYALRSVACREGAVAAGLAERKITFFLPYETNWKGQPRVRHMEPLLPGYVFVLCEAQHFADLRGLEGVQGFVRYMRDDGLYWPAAFPANAILGLQADERSGAFDWTRDVKPPKYHPRKGDRVQITKGTYLGYFAKVLRSKAEGRRELLIEGFDPPRRKTLDASNLEAA